MTLHKIDMTVEVIAESREDAENYMCKILDTAFVYGVGQSEHTAQDRPAGTDVTRVFDYHIKEHHPTEITFPSVGYLIEKLSERTGMLQGEIEEILYELKEAEG